MPTPYSRRYTPPAPILEIALSDVDGDVFIGPVEALLDTGSDGSLVPISYLEQLEVPIAREARLQSHWGEKRTVWLYLIDIVIEGVRLAGVEVVGDDRGQGVLLGRNVLNTLDVRLNGPSETTNVLQ
jgi:predicted aspartyl protease